MSCKGELPEVWQALITPSEASALTKGRVGADTIRAWCVNGWLCAINNGTKGRPEWLLEPEQFKRDLRRLSRDQRAARRHPSADVIDIEEQRHGTR